VTGLAASAATQVVPGVLGFLVVAGMGVILVFLFRSMNKHLRKVNEAARREAEAAANGQRPSDGGDFPAAAQPPARPARDSGNWAG
jgi:hypothetical protein